MLVHGAAVADDTGRFLARTGWCPIAGGIIVIIVVIIIARVISSIAGTRLFRWLFLRLLRDRGKLGQLRGRQLQVGARLQQHADDGRLVDRDARVGPLIPEVHDLAQIVAGRVAHVHR